MKSWWQTPILLGCLWKMFNWKQRLTFRFRNFWVSRLLVSKKKFWFRKIGYRKKSLGFGFREFGFGKNFAFGILGLKKKSRFWFRKIWSWKKSPGFSIREFGLGKKFRNIWSRKNSRFWFWKTWSGKRKNQSNKKESRPSKPPSLLFEI